MMRKIYLQIGDKLKTNSFWSPELLNFIALSVFIIQQNPPNEVTSIMSFSTPMFKI